MEILWDKQPGDAVWWSKGERHYMPKPFFGVYAQSGKWVLYLGTPVNERIPIAEVTDVDQPPLEYAEQLWRLRCG